MQRKNRSRLARVVLLTLDNADEAFEMAMQKVMATKINALPRVSASIHAHGGHGGKNKKKLLSEVKWPDKSADYTHCILIVAEDIAALSNYLYADAHVKDWMGLLKTKLKKDRSGAFREPIVFDQPLEIPYPFDFDASKAMFHPVPFKLKPEADLALYQGIVAEHFNTMPGVVAQFAPAGGHGLAKQELLDKLNVPGLQQWPDKSQGFTHMLFVLFEDQDKLKEYLHGSAHQDIWVSKIKDVRLDNVVFDVPLAPVHCRG